MLMLMWSYSHPPYSAHHDLLYHRNEPIIDSHSFDSLVDSGDSLPLAMAWPYPALIFHIMARCPFCHPDLYRGFGSLLITTLMSLFLVDVCYSSDVDTPRAVIVCFVCFYAFPFRFVRLVGAFRFPCTITLGSMLHDNTRDRNRLISLRLFTFSLFASLKLKSCFVKCIKTL